MEGRTEEPVALLEQLGSLAALATPLRATRAHSPCSRVSTVGFALSRPQDRGVRCTVCQPLSKVGSLTPCHVDGQFREPRRQ